MAMASRAAALVLVGVTLLAPAHAFAQNSKPSAEITLQAAFELCPKLVRGEVEFPDAQAALVWGLTPTTYGDPGAQNLANADPNHNVVLVSYAKTTHRCDIQYFGPDYQNVFFTAKARVEQKLKFGKLNSLDEGGTYVQFFNAGASRRQYILMINHGNKSAVIGYTEKANF